MRHGPRLCFILLILCACPSARAEEGWRVLLRHNGGVAVVSLSSAPAAIETRVTTWLSLSADKVEGFEPFLPAFCALRHVAFESPDTVRVRLAPGLDLAGDPERVLRLGEELTDGLVTALEGTEARRYILEAVDPATGSVVAWSDLAPEPPPVRKEYERAAGDRDRSQQPPVWSADRPTGFLSGKSVYLNAGHGRVWRDGDYWSFQRPFLNDIVEDLSNIDAVAVYLAAYCHNAGARVDCVRELDPNPAMIVVDDADGASNPANGTYVETGSGWTDSTGGGYANGYAPYASGTNPFDLGGNRLANTAPTPTAWAIWTPNLPGDGYYNVYVSYWAYSARASDAHYVVRHAGGETDFRVDQKGHRGTWVLLGRFYFEAGHDPDRGAVVLLNDSADATGSNVSADAVRFGGGTGLISRGASGTSGFPRYDEEARYNIQFMGCPESEYDFADRSDESDGWTGRLRYCGWQNEPGEDACYVAWHSNAGGGSGTSTFVHSNSPSPGSEELRIAVHDEVVNDIRRAYDPSWTDRGKHYGDYGEANGNNVGHEMPVFLFEYAFHDHATKDSVYMRDPKFRRIVARAVYQGFAKYFAERDGVPVRLLPEPPQRFVARAESPSRAVLSWAAPPTDTQGVFGDPATSYRVYQSDNGYGFDNGTAVAGTTCAVADLAADRPHYFRVTAVNAGGESFPTQTLAVRVGTAGAPRLLLVDGFDKVDKALIVETRISGYHVDRDYPERVNALDYAVQHAEAVHAWGGRLDCADDGAVGAGEVGLGDYAAVVWMCGAQSERHGFDPTDDAVFDAAQEAALTAYVAAGGALMLSGADVAWDLHLSGDDGVLADTLGAVYQADDSGGSLVVGAGGALAGLAAVSIADDGVHTTAYRSPDVIAPAPGSTAALVYDASTQVADGFETLGGWQDPNFSSQTRADPESTFTIVSSPVYAGAGAGELHYLWETDGYIREYDSIQRTVLTNSVLTLHVHGDASGTEMAMVVRDAEEDLLMSGWTTVDWAGWRAVRWDLGVDPYTAWVVRGDGLLSGPVVAVDSVHFRYGGATDGRIVLDHLETRFKGGVQTIAAVQRTDPGRLLFLAFPFETIRGEESRRATMAAVLDFLTGGASQTLELY